MMSSRNASYRSPPSDLARRSRDRAAVNDDWPASRRSPPSGPATTAQRSRPRDLWSLNAATPRRIRGVVTSLSRSGAATVTSGIGQVPAAGAATSRRRQTRRLDQDECRRLLAGHHGRVHRQAERSCQYARADHAGRAHRVGKLTRTRAATPRWQHSTASAADAVFGLSVAALTPVSTVHWWHDVHQHAPESHRDNRTGRRPRRLRRRDPGRLPQRSRRSGSVHRPGISPSSSSR